MSIGLKNQSYQKLGATNKQLRSNYAKNLIILKRSFPTSSCILKCIDSYSSYNTHKCSQNDVYTLVSVDCFPIFKKSGDLSGDLNLGLNLGMRD